MIRQYRSLTPGEFITVGVDTSAGGVDYCAAQFLSTDNLDVPLIYHDKILATEMTPIMLQMLERIYDITGIKPCVAYERNNGGVFELERLASLNRHNKFSIYESKPFGMVNNSEAKIIGWNTSAATRPKMLADLKEFVDKHLLTIYDEPTLKEMFSFVVVQTSSSWKAQAEKGSHDDLVMSLAIALQLYLTEHKPHTVVNKSVVVNNSGARKKWSIG
jgi:hypothetical protein